MYTCDNIIGWYILESHRRAAESSTPPTLLALYAPAYIYTHIHIIYTYKIYTHWFFGFSAVFLRCWRILTSVFVLQVCNMWSICLLRICYMLWFVHVLLGEMIYCSRDNYLFNSWNDRSMVEILTTTLKVSQVI